MKGGNDGKGVDIAIVGRSDISLSDVESFRTIFHLPFNDPTVIYATTDPGVIPGDDEEAILDVEWSGAVGGHLSTFIPWSTAGVEAVYATYNGDATFTGSSSRVISIRVAKAKPALALTARSAQVKAGSQTSITAVLSSALANCSADGNGPVLRQRQRLGCNPAGTAASGELWQRRSDSGYDRSDVSAGSEHHHRGLLRGRELERSLCEAGAVQVVPRANESGLCGAGMEDDCSLLLPALS